MKNRNKNSMRLMLAVLFFIIVIFGGLILVSNLDNSVDGTNSVSFSERVKGFLLCQEGSTVCPYSTPSPAP